MHTAHTQQNMGHVCGTMDKWDSMAQHGMVIHVERERPASWRHQCHNSCQGTPLRLPPDGTRIYDNGTEPSNGHHGSTDGTRGSAKGSCVGMQSSFVNGSVDETRDATQCETEVPKKG
jgi:hypothetical protein